MKKKNYDLFIVLSFLVIIFGVLCWYPIKHILINRGLSELLITDNWVFYERNKTDFIGKITDFLKEKIVSIDNRTINYFPLYYQLNSSFYNINYNLNQSLYSNDVPIGLNADKQYIYYNKKDDFYYLKTAYNEEELKERLEKQITFFNNLRVANEKVSLNIYLPLRYEFTTLNEYNLNNYFKNFIDNLDSGINVDYMKINSIEEYKQNFFLTDHHWNINGALMGYKDIMKMLKKKEIPDLKTKTYENIKYYGSITKSTLSTKVYDEFMDIDVDLDYDVKINDKSNEKYKPRKITYDGNNIFFDYYVHYFNGQYGLVEFDYDNKEGNLLIFSDSYSWPIDYLIASHFDKTYVINFRYDEWKYKDLYYNRFIEENNITDVLFLYQGETIIFDQDNFDFNNKISW